MMREDLGPTWVGIISHLRSANVPAMEALVGPATWYVGDGEGDDYRAAGASSVVESGALCRSRNAIMDDAFARGVPAVELSDDLRSLKVLQSRSGKNKAVPTDFASCVREMRMACLANNARMAGCAPTTNVIFFNPKKPINTRAFIVGDFIYIRPTELRFDESMRLKEDYDYTAQHIERYGAVARCDFLVPSFLHRKNAGGAVAVRTRELEQASIHQLTAKWPGWFRPNPNPKRQDEVIMQAPRVQR